MKLNNATKIQDVSLTRYMVSALITVFMVIIPIGLVSASVQVHIQQLAEAGYLRLRFETSQEASETVVLWLYQEDSGPVNVTSLIRQDSFNPTAIPSASQISRRRSDYPGHQVVQSIELGNIAVSVATLMLNGRPYCDSHCYHDLLLWQKTSDGYRLLAIYPKSIGGCLYCRFQGLDTRGDTIITSVGGYDGEKKWWYKDHFLIENMRLFRIRLNHIKEIHIGVTDPAYPLKAQIDTTSVVYQYDQDGNTISTKRFSGSKYTQVSPARQLIQSDSLELFLPADQLPDENLRLVKSIYSKNIGVDYTMTRNGYSLIRWEGVWYWAKRKGRAK